MNKFESKIVQYEDRIQLELKGNLDEDAQLPKLPSTMKLLVKTGGIRLINSSGIKTWYTWITSLRNETILYDCPFVLVKHFSTIKGILPDWVKVASFYVPYSNPTGTERKDVLYERGVDFQDDGSYKVRKLFDHEGNLLEIDVVEGSYFKFLKRAQK